MTTKNKKLLLISSSSDRKRIARYDLVKIAREAKKERLGRLSGSI